MWQRTKEKSLTPLVDSVDEKIRKEMKKIIFLLLFCSPVFGDETGFTYSSTTYIIDTSSTNFVPVHELSFYDKNNKEIGSVDWKDGKVKFSGNVEKSAKVFFEYWYKVYVDGCREKK